MLAGFACIMLFSPIDMVELSIDRSVFPRGAEHWDRIGLFNLKDGDKQRLVLLYRFDTDSVASKEMAKSGFGGSIYPNSFAIHAIRQTSSGKWVHQEVFGGARVGFTKVVKSTSDQVILECRSKFMIMVQPGEDFKKVIKRADEINRPFTKSISFAKGVLASP